MALRRGRRVAQLGPRSPDYLSSEAVYASLADLRSRRLAEMDGFLANRDRDLDPELLNRAQRRRCGYKESMRLKDQNAARERMVHAHHARRRDAARRANIANRNFDERRYEASRDAYAAAIQQAEHLEALVAAADDKARGELMRKLSEATRRAEQSAAQVAFASAKAEASLKRYKAPPPIGPTEKIPIELDPFMHDLVAVDQPYSYHGDMVEASSSTASQTYRDAGAPRSAASINHELSQAEHILHSGEGAGRSAAAGRTSAARRRGKLHAAVQGTHREGGLGGDDVRRRWRTRKVPGRAARTPSTACR